MQTSIVPTTENTTISYGYVWREMSESETNEATIVQWLIEGQVNRPVKIVAFNTVEGWSRDITHDIATKLLDLNQDGIALSSAAREFVERVTGDRKSVV